MTDTANELYDRGIKYLNGDGVEKNFLEAETWLREAADARHPEAQYKLAMMALGLAKRAVWNDDEGRVGVDVESDVDCSEAIHLLKEAGMNGHVLAQQELGKIYCGMECEGGDIPRDRLGFQNDFAEAARWLEMAAAQGDFESQWILSDFYREGKGVSQDHERAAKLLIAAYDNETLLDGDREELINSMEELLREEKLNEDLQHKIEERLKGWTPARTSASGAARHPTVPATSTALS